MCRLLVTYQGPHAACSIYVMPIVHGFVARTCQCFMWILRKTMAVFKFIFYIFSLDLHWEIFAKSSTCQKKFFCTPQILLVNLNPNTHEFGNLVNFEKIHPHTNTSMLKVRMP